jgi:hypothetical protein
MDEPIRLREAPMTDKPTTFDARKAAHDFVGVTACWHGLGTDGRMHSHSSYCNAAMREIERAYNAGLAASRPPPKFARRSWKPGEVCRHGGLGRQCEPCELEDEVGELRATLTRVREALVKVAAIHARYCAADEGSPEEDAALNDFDDVCCNEVTRALEASDGR